jgi:formylglycine-generating enzyme required for sulfatase activity
MAIEQTIVVRLDGYAEDGITVTPRKGYSQLLPFELELLDDATGGGYPRAVTTGSGTRLRLIPAGTVQMGASRSDGATTFEINRYRRVEISSAFYLAATEMTKAEFRRCQPDHDSGSFNGESLNQDLQPVVRVTVQEAFACLNQLSIAAGLQPVYEPRDGMLVPNHARSGYRLPTEAEFALALRVSGREGEAPLKFPWGPEPLAPADRIENVGDLSARQLLENTLRTYTDGYPVSAPVGSLLPNAAGLYDMGGNVSEWVQDFYDPLEDFADEVIVDPRGPATGRANIVRGPSWRSWREERLRLSFVDFQDVGREDLGFRIARNLN